MSIATDLRTKNDILYQCKNCDFITRKKTDFNRHLTTQKHKKLTLATDINIKSTEKNDKIIYQCEICQKTYLERTGLWRHKKKCVKKEQDEDDIHSDDDNIDEQEAKHFDKAEVYDLVKYLMKENSELKNMIIEVCKNVQPVNNTTNNNCHNKTFNLNVFLNEQCKDAINMSDFIDSIIVNLSDLETTGRVGYAEGLSKLFITHLQRLDKHKRPIHCSDLKREVLYIKDENMWEKDTFDKQRLQRAIKEVTYKNIRQIAEWVKKYPDCRQSDSRKNDQYIRITMNSMSGGTEEEQERNINKIIANIAKEVVIEK